MTEEYEMLRRCVVCCVKIKDADDYPNYCETHCLSGDPSMPPIPLREWFAEYARGADHDRFMTGRPLTDD